MEVGCFDVFATQAYNAGSMLGSLSEFRQKITKLRTLKLQLLMINLI